MSQISAESKMPLGVRLRRNAWIYAMMTPALLLFLTFSYLPMVGIIISFNDYKINKGFAGIFQSKWVGFQWFTRFFESYYFKRLMVNTLTVNIMKLIIGFPAPILFALLLNEVKNKYYKKVVQTVSYMPHFVSWVVVMQILNGLLSPSQGIINNIIKSFGGEAIYFTNELSWYYPLIIGTSVWKGFGWGSIVYLAAIAGVDVEMYEAAVLDGCGRLKQAWYITLPSIKSLIVMMLILNMGSLINADFQQIFVYVGSNTALYDIADVIDTYVYRIGLSSMKMSYATAIGLFKSVISLIMLTLSDFVSKKLGEDGIF